MKKRGSQHGTKLQIALSNMAHRQRNKAAHPLSTATTRTDANMDRRVDNQAGEQADRQADGQPARTRTATDTQTDRQTQQTDTDRQAGRSLNQPQPVGRAFRTPRTHFDAPLHAPKSGAADASPTALAAACVSAGVLPHGWFLLRLGLGLLVLLLSLLLPHGSADRARPRGSQSREPAEPPRPGAPLA